MAENPDRGQVNTDAAEIYEEFFIPALFGTWPEQVIKMVEVKPGQKVLDVACGTGIFAREVVKKTGKAVNITGVDINEGMLAVAQRKEPAVEWTNAPAEQLPFDDNSYDITASLFALMFFEDRVAAVKEMYRVLKPGGTMAVAVWDKLENTPGYRAVVDILQRLFGDAAANALRAPYNLGDKQEVKSIFSDAGMPDAEITTVTGTAKFPSIDSWMYTDVRGWTLSDMIDEEQYQLLLELASSELKEFEQSDRSVSFPAPAHIVMFNKT